MGRAFLYHLLADHPRHSPKGPATTTRANPVRVETLLFGRPLGIPHGAGRSWSATSRFQNLAQETQLVGQIAAALLLQGESGPDNLIHPATLRRISQGLDRERRSREWLRCARRFAKERAQVRGLGILGRSTTSTTGRPDDARAEAAALGIEPRLVLRPTEPQGDSWEA